jgi:hypothetical protein
MEGDPMNGLLAAFVAAAIFDLWCCYRQRRRPGFLVPAFGAAAAALLIQELLA